MRPPGWFHFFPDHIVTHSDARLRRSVNFWLFVLWVFPGVPVWLLFANKLWFVGFMSLYAIWATHWSSFSAETPTEAEFEVTNGSKTDQEVQAERDEHEHRHDRD